MGANHGPVPGEPRRVPLPVYLGEPDWTEENKPCVVGRKPLGRLAIANSDAGGEAYLDGAIEQAYRAVRELLG